ncbi:HEAT repeat domain-containing protein [Maribellus sediminis]|uniref:HEAT repeat domain-containing protein n=1 Tax=Maribellus sediminis TaxID=2696285 RepID=UPI00142F93DC|nr:HEAT repeat domain-containing protein [Maribellus sediminis]
MKPKEPKKILQNFGLFLLALVFSIGLMFAFIEIPQMLDKFLQSNVGTPQSDPGYNNAKIELFFEVVKIRWIGYICLGLIFLMIILGFVTKKNSFIWVGGIALFLPVFATFAYSMFYLAGLGLLNVIFFPLQEISLSMIDLGKVVLIPYWILLWIAGLFNWNAHQFLIYLFMISGTLIFVLGVYAWIKVRFANNKVAKHWIYKYSRHPQYLGWIIWSYGLMLFGPTVNDMKKSWGWYGTLPWLLSTLVIIGICFLEELKMSETAGDDYDEYRKRTPFLFPAPVFLKRVIQFPMYLLIRKNRPENRKEIGLTLTVYAVLLMAFSLFWVDLQPAGDPNALSAKPYDRERADLLISEITREQSRRNRTLQPFAELLSMGSETYPAFYELMESSDPDVRGYAIQAAGAYTIPEAIPILINALNDSVSGIVEAAVRSLGSLKAVQAEDELLSMLINGSEKVKANVLLETLSSIGCEEIMPYLGESLDDDFWYYRASALKSMMRIDFERAKPYLYQHLEDEDPNVRREVVYMLLDSLPTDAVPYLEKVTDDDDWDVRFYARQAIKEINKKTK